MVTLSQSPKYKFLLARAFKFMTFLDRQSIFGNIVSETFKGITRIVGWGLMSLVGSPSISYIPSNSLHQVLYPSVFESRRRRRRETPSERRARAADDLSSRMLPTKEKAFKRGSFTQGVHDWVKYSNIYTLTKNSNANMVQLEICIG